MPLKDEKLYHHMPTVPESGYSLQETEDILALRREAAIFALASQGEVEKYHDRKNPRIPYQYNDANPHKFDYGIDKVSNGLKQYELFLHQFDDAVSNKHHVIPVQSINPAFDHIFL